jgi:hypothetical protein
MAKLGNARKKIVPDLWYNKEAEDAARFYASIFPDSRVDRVTALQNETPSGPPGSVKVVEFTLMEQPFMAISAGTLDSFNHSVSFVVYATIRPKSTATGTPCSKAAASRNNVAGSRTSTACPGRSCRLFSQT